jgi:hypothetical protein
MKISQICALAMLLVVGTAVAFADGINDPKIVIHGVNSGNYANVTCPPNGCKDVGLNFTFSVPKGGSGTLYFTNNSGKNWTSLLLIEKGEPAADISCVQTLFKSCSTKTLANGSVEILLSGVNSPHMAQNARTGIANGQSFDISFVCVTKNCWPSGLQFSGHANVTSVPEPGTVALMVTGFGALFSRRKQWMKRFTA